MTLVVISVIIGYCSFRLAKYFSDDEGICTFFIIITSCCVGFIPLCLGLPEGLALVLSVALGFYALIGLPQYF